MNNNYFLMQTLEKNFLVCILCNKWSEGFLLSDNVSGFNHECSFINFFPTSDCSVQLHQENNNVFHLYSSIYYPNEGNDNGNTKTNGIK